ncbi:glycosyl hydrolase family 18 protein [uncultured Jatrophihabitans sp.]|uniref:glycosyl hydrolase family 18 protein n=1 Tax=uncultured Jatrophihabitans sp. TaxID=1610747 RepID=UPI0035CBEC7A
MTVTRALTIATAAVVAVCSLTAFTADGRHADRAGSAPTVIGYVESGDGPAALRRNLPSLTVAAVDGVNINGAGTRVSLVDAGARAMLAATHRARRSAELLVGNFSSRLGDFDPAAAHRLFSSAQHRRTVIAALVTDARRGWNGIHLDLESLRATDRAGLTTFTRELRAALPRRTSLSMAVMASTTRQGYRQLGYDLPALSRLLTRLVLMGYDQHGPTWTKAGPVGGLPWARRTLRAMLASVPRTKAVLGVAGYGYTWPTHGTGTAAE